MCRPLVELSKKELALFRLYEGIAALPTQPYLLHEDLLHSAEGNSCRNSRPSVRWLLQDFLFGMQEDNSAAVRNLLSACEKLGAPFAGWTEDEQRRFQSAAGRQISETRPLAPLRSDLC